MSWTRFYGFKEMSVFVWQNFVAGIARKLIHLCIYAHLAVNNEFNVIIYDLPLKGINTKPHDSLVWIREFSNPSQIPGGN